MKFNKYLPGIAASAIALSCVGAVSAQVEMGANTSELKLASSVKAAVSNAQGNQAYIVKMKGASAIAKAAELGELTPSNQLVATIGNNYDATTPLMQAYVATVKQRQADLAAEVGIDTVTHQLAHAFNGFSATLSANQVAALRSHPDVAAVYDDELHQVHTANTPAFLGLTGPGGQHTLGFKGEDVVVGIIDTGIWPENRSFAEDSSIPEMTYGAAPLGWAGECNVGSIGEFVNADDEVVYNDELIAQDSVECNNKLIGARYFGSSFSSVYEIQFGLGEFASARDADGHGSHTGGTSAGNAGVNATIQGAEVGTASGIAPRARVAAYKVCWNSSFVSEAGVAERGCFFGDSMAAIDQAVVDGVDVLNYSIGNSIDINSPVYNAALRAASAGVFFAASAGNSGPDADTVSNIAPWIATVAASTYDGESSLIGNALEINTGTLAGTNMFSIHGAIGTAIPAEGFSGDLALAEPILGCGEITNDLTGQIALIQRGTCGFVEKMANAEAMGAVGVVVFTDSRDPTAMGGTDTGLGIPGVMVQADDGAALVDSIGGSDQAVNVTMGFTGIALPNTEVGNIMADFSSRGVNLQTSDMLKPDITAPGVRILAASSPEQLRISSNTQGNDFAYLSGTSMSSPHIAGMAALLMGQHPDWTTAQVKSAMMTSARQDLVKEDGETPADPFDFGAGHVDPVPAMTPGLTYNTNFADYLGFLCGQGEDALVGELSEGTTCGNLSDDGFAIDATQLNYPSISIGELIGSEVVTRTVTDVTGEGGVYTVSVEAPVGTTVEVATFDASGVETDSSALEVMANGSASYAVTISTVQGFTPNTWSFGAITLENTATGTTVRSPIAAFLVAEQTIVVPESVSATLVRGRTRLTVSPLYSGAFAVESAGAAPAEFVLRTPLSNPGDFDFSAGVGQVITFGVPEGSTLLRLSLRDALVFEAGSAGAVPFPGTNLDLQLWACRAAGCSAFDSATGPTSDEDLIIVNPIPSGADQGVEGTDINFYAVFIQGVDTLGAAAVDAIMPIWIVDGSQNTMRVRASTRAIEGRFQNISISTRGLEAGVHMGTITFFDNNGEAQGTTALELVQP